MRCLKDARCKSIDWVDDPDAALGARCLLSYTTRAALPAASLGKGDDAWDGQPSAGIHNIITTSPVQSHKTLQTCTNKFFSLNICKNNKTRVD